MGWYFLDFETDPEFDLYWKGTAVNLSADIGYFILNTPKFKVGASCGLNIGIIVAQDFQVVEESNTGDVDFYISRQFVPSLLVNADLVYNVTDSFAINVRPTWNEFIHVGQLGNYVERNLGLKLMLMYSIS